MIQRCLLIWTFFFAPFSFRAVAQQNEGRNDLYFDPYAFVLDCFREKQIVLLGEPHHVKQHIQFLQRLLPKLHQAGIPNLCYEFLPYDRQAVSINW